MRLPHYTNIVTATYFLVFYRLETLSFDNFINDVWRLLTAGIQQQDYMNVFGLCFEGQHGSKLRFIHSHYNNGYVTVKC